MLRPSFVPPKPVRELRNLTRTRTVLIEERSGHKQRVEKLLEDAHIKLSTVATDLFGVSGRSMLEALIAGERDPRALAFLAKGRMAPKQQALTEALTGQFEEHHGYLCRMLLDTLDCLSAQIEKLSVRITAAITELPGPDGDDSDSDGRRPGPSLVEQLDEIPGIGPAAAQVLLAELGTDMRVFPSPAHLTSWAKLTPRTVQSGPKTSARGTGKGNPWLKGVLGEAALAASRTDTFLGARYRRLVKRRGHKKALVAVARSILVIAWHLIHDPTARFTELGSDHYQRRIDPERKTHELVRQLKALGHSVALTPADQAV